MIEAALLIVAGIAFYGGVHQLYSGVRHTSAHPHFIHALMYLLLCAFALSSALPYQAQSLETLVRAGKLSVSFGLLLWGALVWFVAAYTDYKPRLLPAALSLVWILLLVANIGAPFSLLYSDVAPVSEALPDGQAAIAFHTRLNPWWSLAQAAMLASLLFALYVAFRLHRADKKGAALMLGFGLLVLSGASVSDALVTAGLVQAAFLTPFGFLVLLVVAGYAGRRADIAHEQSSQRLVLPPPHTVEKPSPPAEAPAPTRSEAEPEPGPPHAAALRLDEAALTEVSDNLVDIAVYATLAMNRCKRGDTDLATLETLFRKVRNQAISTRRIVNRMMHPAAATRPDDDADLPPPE